MLIYLAAAGHTNGGNDAGWAGVLASAVATLFGVAVTFRFGTLRIFRRSRDLAALEESADTALAKKDQDIERLLLARESISDQIEDLRELESSDADNWAHKSLPGADRSLSTIEPSKSDTVALSSDQALIERMLQVRSSVLRDLNIVQDSHSRLADIRAKRHMSQISSLFTHARMAFYSFLGITLISSGILLYGAYLAIYGHIASGVIVALSSAVPGGFSAGLYRISRSADRQSETALTMLNSEVERETQIDKMLNVARGIDDPETQEAVQTLSALRAAFPDASPQELSSLLNAVRNNSRQKINPSEPDRGIPG